jgi:D-lactate dehydrogenase
MTAHTSEDTDVHGSLARELSSAFGADAVTQRSLDRLKYAHDASHYLLVPQTVVTPRSAAAGGDPVARLRPRGSAADVRSAGTSLSGQGLTDSVLVDTRQQFKGVEVLDGGERVRVQPGVTVRAVNALLAPHGRKLGPDPASESVCTVGGVVANNSSGMHCGTEFNTYRTLESMVLVLPVERCSTRRTRRPGHDLLRRSRPARGTTAAASPHSGQPTSVATIERLFAMKNTMGYGLNAFLDYEDPLDILMHLMIGSEGTLGFVAEAVFRTVAVVPHVATGLLVFADVETATSAVPELIEAGTVTAELLDATSLFVSSRDPGRPP